MTAFVARQPIFDRQQVVQSYELLYRSSAENRCICDDLDRASLTVIDQSLSVFGLDALVGEHRAFINLTRRVIVDGLVSVLPVDRVVLELLETVEPDAEIIGACRALKEAGYQLALDDFVHKPEAEPLLALADVVKVDFLATPSAGRRELARLRDRHPQLHLLAEKVETQEDFREGTELGYELFQGYFFCKAQIVTGKQLAPQKLSQLRFLQAISRAELDLDEVEGIVRQDLSLSVRLLRYLNSAALGLRSKVASIRHAMVLLGERALRQWAYVSGVAALGADKCPELVSTCLVRARFCELAARPCGLGARANDLFLVGLLYAIDALLDRPKEQALSEMALTDELRAAVLGAPSALTRVLQLVLAYEQANWEVVQTLAREARLDEDRLLLLYTDAVAWAQTATCAMAGN